MDNKNVTSKAKKVPAKKAVEAVAEPLLSFDEYIKLRQPHYGLVVSFQYEASKSENGLVDRSEVQWDADFEAQSNKTYK